MSVGILVSVIVTAVGGLSEEKYTLLRYFKWKCKEKRRKIVSCKLS